MHSSYGHAPSHVSDDAERTRNLFDVKIIIFFCELDKYIRKHSTRTHTHPYEYMYANFTPISTSETLCRHILRLTQAPRCRREHRLPLKTQRR
jgi:hypothetical protein